MHLKTFAQDLHVLGMVANAVNQLIGLDLTGTDFMDGGEKREFLFHAFGFQHVVDLFGGDGTLKLELKEKMHKKKFDLKLACNF